MRRLRFATGFVSFPRLPLGRLAGALLILAAAGAVAVLAWIPGKKPQTPQAKVEPVNVDVIIVRPESEFVDASVLPGVVEANRVVNVAAEVAGRVERIALREGQPCRQGDALIVLNTDLIQAEYDQAKAQAEFDAREYQRISELFDRQVATNTELDNVRTRAQASAAAFQAAKARLDRTTIVAPVDGILNRLPVEKGEYLKEGSPVAEIVDVETVKVVVYVPESDAHFVKLGQKPTVVSDTPERKELQGTISYISELADERTRTTRVEIEVDNRLRQLRSGQSVRAIITRRVIQDAILVPLSAVIPLEDGKAVYVVNDNRAKRLDVELGLLKGSRVLVRGGALKAGDRLIVSGHRYVSPGRPVEIRKVVEE